MSKRTRVPHGSSGPNRIGWLFTLLGWTDVLGMAIDVSCHFVRPQEQTRPQNPSRELQAMGPCAGSLWKIFLEKPYRFPSLSGVFITLGTIELRSLELVYSPWKLFLSRAAGEIFRRPRDKRQRAVCLYRIERLSCMKPYKMRPVAAEFSGRSARQFLGSRENAFSANINL
jgi:hypothetical protein